MHREIRSNALDFLYPKGAEAPAASEVTLRTPVRVGIAFPPTKTAHWGDSFTEDRKTALLERVAAAFRGRSEIGSVEVVPSTYLQPEGGFENVDRLASAFGVDLIVLVSYAQNQFSDSGGGSILYWTIVGAYVVKGEKNEIRTNVDAAVFDIPSRMLLFNASGQSSVGGKSTPIKREQGLRELSDEGFSLAIDELIVNLDASLGAFKQQIETGTVRGAGTPAVTVVDAKTGLPVAPGDSGGAAGPTELAALGLLLVGAWLGLRSRVA
jgi:rhombotail lipoprotein